MKRTITNDEYLQILGLLTLAHKHNRVVSQATNAMEDIIESEDRYSQLTDLAWEDNFDLDKTLKYMGITVTTAASTSRKPRNAGKNAKK